MEILFSYHEGKSYKYLIGCVCIVLCGLLALAPYGSVLYAGEAGVSLTIAPPLIQINLQPGETWNSSISVVNNNAYDLMVYAEPVLFEPGGESGRPVFISLPHGGEREEQGTSTSTGTLADWIVVPEQSVEIKREQTYQLPVTITVPEDAPPGGHYAAILIGNRAPEGTKVEDGTVSVTSSISVLIFLSVSGDVVENGRIRDFATEKSVYENPEAHFSLRFENQGNVHLLPQGNIVIYNMFGKVRGTIPVNHQKDYGNVLPNSIRKFDFTWKAEAGVWDIGRYKAEATIAYGKEQKQTALATTYFYVLPIVPFLEIVGGLLVFILFTGWVLRAYIRRALAIETAQLRNNTSHSEHSTVLKESHTTSETISKVKLGSTLMLPIKTGFVDLRDIGTSKEKLMHTSHVRTEAVVARGEIANGEVVTLGTFLRTYWLFFVSIIIFAIGGFTLSVYFEDVMTVSRDYSVTEVRPDGSEVELKEE